MKISICIPTFNQADYLIQSVRSASNQSLSPFEIIVSNDCSTDNTSRVLQSLSKDIPQLKVINQPENLGIAGNTDASLRLATGDLVVRLDSDDYLAPSFCEKLSSLLKKYPDAGYAHAAVQEIDQNGHYLKKRWLSRSSGFQPSIDGLKAARKGYRVAANILMFRRSALEKVNFLTDRPNYVEDFHLNASLSATGYGNVYLHESLSFYRVWIDAEKTRQKRKLMEITGVRRVFQEILEPEYKKRGYNLKGLHRSKAAIACSNSDCLSWNVYTKKEKIELKKEILKLSSSSKVKFFTWLYMNGYGGGISLINKIKGSIKLFAKKLFFPISQLRSIN